LKEVETVQDPNFTDLAKEVTVKEPVHYESGGNKLVALIDCGVKYGILRSLLQRGLDVMRVPYDFSAEQILEYNPNGVIISNGPGDPKMCVKTIQTVRELVDEDMPMMGICLGTQVLALALGGDTYKLKYGHRSQNQPALDLETGRCYITTQNHGYTVERDSLKDTGLEAWFMNANDKTVEGVKHKTKLAFALQWHPEASPGPYDTEFLFNRFRKLAEAK
jgi:carbamoyl-phosphate synthase small subunit